MDDKKSFFASLEPKSALIVGLVAGFMSLCTIGFFVLGFMMLRGSGTTSLTSGALAQNNVDVGTQGTPGDVAPVVPTNIPKTDKPNVELFVMSDCPYGQEMERAYIPAWKMLKGKANIDVKFVSYAMHGKKEVDENTLQYCIQKEQNDKYISYLECYVTTGDSAACRKSAGVNESKANSCIAKANKDLGITKEYEDTSRWLSGKFPIYPVHQTLNDKYGVQGSPTLIVNGVEVSQVSRTPEGVKQVICAAFNNPPAECQQVLSNAGSPNLAAAGCGV